jgi:biotin synthase-like enzyme
MNGVMVGDLLTTIGNSVDDDYRMFERTGYEL